MTFRFDLRVTPGARRTALCRDGDGLHLDLAAPPVDGRANDEAVRFLAREVFHRPRSAVRLVLGRRFRRKTFEVDGDPQVLAAVLDEAAGPRSP